MSKSLVKQSKFLSLILRHNPGVVGLTLDDGGWVSVEELLNALKTHQKEMSRERLLEIVETNEKRRFVLSDDHSRIRAAQGHSIGVDLGLSPITPPDILFHGTAEKSIPSIQEQGLHKGQRDHVHLSADENTATKVGMRHGRPRVLRILSGKMAAAGYNFYQADNGVWLTELVPVEYIEF